MSKRLKQPRPGAVPSSAVEIPHELPTPYRGSRSTQRTFGSILSTLSRECPELVRRVVTVSPDVASSTNLGGWINNHEVWGLGEQEELPEDQQARILHWAESPRGQHIELGISENNLFLMLGQLGLSMNCSANCCSPSARSTIRSSGGTRRLFYSAYSGARFIVVGTPSGVSLSAKGAFISPC